MSKISSFLFFLFFVISILALSSCQSNENDGTLPQGNWYVDDMQRFQLPDHDALKEGLNIFEMSAEKMVILGAYVENGQVAYFESLAFHPRKDSAWYTQMETGVPYETSSCFVDRNGIPFSVSGGCRIGIPLEQLDTFFLQYPEREHALPPSSYLLGRAAAKIQLLEIPKDLETIKETLVMTAWSWSKINDPMAVFDEEAKQELIRKYG